MQLRPYQQKAINSVYDYLRANTDNPCVVIPTGGGKTPVLATIVKDALELWDGRVLILSHVKELLEQAVEKIHCIAPEIDVGIYSAGLNRADTAQKCIVGGIQSVYKHGKELGYFDLVIIDECQLISSDGESMYQKLLADLKDVNPIIRIIGLTATPYRMTSGMICAPKNVLNAICFEVGVKELMASNYLAKLTSKASRDVIDTSSLHIRYGEFVDAETNALMNQKERVKSACNEIISYTKKRKAVLIFCCGKDHAQAVVKELRTYNVDAECVFGDTLPEFRRQLLDDFKNGKLKYLVNVGVLTTGFDAPITDCIVLLRMTNSPGLYYQMVGRGFRLCDGKENCLVLDFGGNIMRHGPIDQLSINPTGGTRKDWKTCPECCEVIAISARICPVCGYEYPRAEPREIKHAIRHDEVPILSGQQSEVEEFKVHHVTYKVHEKRDALPDSPRTVRIDYYSPMLDKFSEWICPEHLGYTHQKFVRFWQEHVPATPLPHNADEAVSLLRCFFRTPSRIRIQKDKKSKFPKIIGYSYDLPPDTEIPF